MQKEEVIFSLNYGLALLAIYGVVAMAIFIWNFAQFVRCVYYEARYLQNHQNRTMNKNAKNRDGVISLCRIANEPLPFGNDPKCLVREFYVQDITVMFENIEGRFRYKAFHAWIWPLAFVQTLIKATLGIRVKNKLILLAISVVFSLLGWFVSRTMENLLDEMGVFDKIGAFLLSFWNHITQSVGQ